MLPQLQPWWSTMVITRRHFTTGIGTAIAAAAVVHPAHAVRAGNDAGSHDLEGQFAAVEARCGGRLGVGIIDTQAARTASYRGTERFPLCSAYKALGAAAVLANADKGRDDLGRRVFFGAERVLPYSPGTKEHAGAQGMTLAAICEAAVTLSDNTAGNLVLEAIGGPAGFTAFVRGLGDDITRLDRTEPTLNEALPGDPRDTTSPLAMATDLNRLVLGDALSPASRTLLTTWLLACRTGDTRLRAGAPSGWQVGDKTGTGERGTSNDVGVIWPPGRTPMIVTAFIAGSNATQGIQNASIAEVMRVVAADVLG